MRAARANGTTGRAGRERTRDLFCSTSTRTSLGAKRHAAKHREQRVCPHALALGGASDCTFAAIRCTPGSRRRGRRRLAATARIGSVHMCRPFTVKRPPLSTPTAPMLPSGDETAGRCRAETSSSPGSAQPGLQPVALGSRRRQCGLLASCGGDARSDASGEGVPPPPAPPSPTPAPPNRSEEPPPVRGNEKGELGVECDTDADCVSPALDEFVRAQAGP